MENYEVKEINIHNKYSRDSITQIVNEVFDLSLSGEKIYLNTNTRNQKTIYLGAYLKDELAAVNIFISHELMYNNKTVIAYQSCWSATSKNHRNKGLFSLLINSAKKILKGAFIFGFPNHNSSPIFLNKLGFRKVELSKINIPVKVFTDILLKLYLKPIKPTYQLDLENSFISIESELIDLKTNEYKDTIKTFGCYNNLIWGKTGTRKTKLGNLVFFYVGGIQINKPHLLHILFKEVIKSEKIDIIQIIGSSNSTIWDLFRYKDLAPRTEPLIIYDLEMNTQESRFNFITGIKDVF
jgi:hypothetical protein